MYTVPKLHIKNAINDNINRGIQDHKNASDWVQILFFGTCNNLSKSHFYISGAKGLYEIQADFWADWAG